MSRPYIAVIGRDESGRFIPIEGRPYHDKEWLEEMYIRQHLSTNVIGEICQVSPTTIRYFINKFKINIRSCNTLNRVVPIKDENWCKRISEAKKGHLAWNKGIPRKAETKKKVSKGLEKFHKNNPNFQRGPNNHRWKGGITPEDIQIRSSKKYIDWRKAVYARDEYVCVKCGDNKGGNLSAHHVLSFRDYPEERFALDNGVTLCVPCHNEVY